jgi:hypothetical protein
MEGLPVNKTVTSMASYATPTGYILLNFPAGPMTIIGGPFDAYKSGIGVCLEESSDRAEHATILFPIPDFTAPTPAALEAAVAEIINTHADVPNFPVYIGCLGGKGRTGTVIAALVKVSQHLKGPLIDHHLGPVGITRKHFNRLAVETRQQEKVVEDLRPDNVVALLTARAKTGPNTEHANPAKNTTFIGWWTDYFLAFWK